MKQAVKFALSMLGYYVVLVVAALVFLLQTAGIGWLFYLLTALFLVGFGALLYFAGCERGEKAVTRTKTVARQREQGREVSLADEGDGFRPRAAWLGYVLGVLPLLLLALANFALRDVLPPIVEGADNWLGVATRLVFTPFLALAQLLGDNRTLLFLLYIPCSMLVQLVMPIGYLQGPRLYKKKLAMIEKGKRRKMRNLKVNQKPRTPKKPKMEV